MGFPTLKEVFGRSIEGFGETVENGILERCEVSAEGRSITAYACFTDYIKREQLLEICERLKKR